MRRSTRLLADTVKLAEAGNSPELQSAVQAYIAQSRREMNPWWERFGAWYMELPHNRLVLTPMLDWLTKHIRITLPIAVAGFAFEVWFFANHP